MSLFAEHMAKARSRRRRNKAKIPKFSKDDIAFAEELTKPSSAIPTQRQETPKQKWEGATAYYHSRHFYAPVKHLPYPFTPKPRPPFDTQRQRQQLLQDWESMELSNLQKTCLERGLDFNKAVEARDKQNAIVLQNMEKGKKLLGPTKMPNYFNTGDLVVNQTDKKLGHSASAPALNAGRELEARANTAQRLRHKLMESSVLTVATDLLNPRPATFRTIVAEPAFPARRQRRGHQLSRSTTSFHDYIQHKRAESKMSEHTNNSGPAGRPSVEQFDGYGMNRKFAKFYQKETSKPAPLHLLRQDIPIPDVSEIRYFSNGYFPRTGPAKKKALEKTWVWDFPHSNVVDT